MCDCYSYNAGMGHSRNVIATYPWDLGKDDGDNTICLDACIADTVQELWRRGMPTLNSCCGHNEENPSLVVNREDAERIKSILSQIDPRPWKVLAWVLTEM